jgi:CheY-like chemotaxis protein
LPKRALVIDDDKLYLLLVRSSLEKGGWTVDVARDGPAGIDLMTAERYDLVIAGIAVPEPEGLETIARIRDRFPGTRIMAIAGAEAGPDCDCLALARKLGAAGCLRKPFLPNALTSYVAWIMTRPAPADA